MKKLLAALTLMACICITSSAMASSGHQCVQISFKWNYMSDYAIAYAKLYDNGTVQTSDGGYGYWEQFGTAIMMQFTNADTCMPIYSGSKKQGFMECTVSSGPTSPNYYLIKKSKNCAGVGDAIVGEEVEADGPKSYSPE